MCDWDNICQVNPSESLNTLNCNLPWVEWRETEKTDGVALVSPAGKSRSENWSQLELLHNRKGKWTSCSPKDDVYHVIKTRPFFH